MHMNEIICPSCKKAFKVDEAGFADILKQVRDHQFDDELKKRLDLAEKEKVSASASVHVHGVCASRCVYTCRTS